MVRIINRATLDKLTGEAQKSARLRKNFNYHPDLSDPINRMLNAVEPYSYVQPHKHENPDKREVFLLLTGRMAVVFFDDNGVISDHVILDKHENFGVEIPPSTWHTIVALEKGTVVYEVKDGPYAPSNDKNFATWAPGEGENKSAAYLKELLAKLNLL